VPEHSTVIGIPAKVVRRHGVAEGEQLEHGKLPDPQAQEIDDLRRRVEELETAIRSSLAQR
jgi:serine O-acetyltransferase